jgi:UDP-N-acetylmuramate dehydrogenase
MPIEKSELYHRYHSNQCLKNLSTFAIGGPCRFFLEARKVAEIEEALHWAHLHSIPYFILGKGSNCLFDDRGYNGLVIQNRIDFCEFNGKNVSVGAGASFSFLGLQTAKRALQGLEFASGIPGSVGGAIYMNAGANGQETRDSLEKVLFLHEDGKQTLFEKKDLHFSYRTSPFQSMSGCILSAEFSLEEGVDARKKQLGILTYRKKTQPGSAKSAGCVFRNPSLEISAGALIDQCGLKGESVGGAEVSPIHANFIVNSKGAKAKDVLDLIELIQQTVFDKTGFKLETEIRAIPYE